jgi:hypothetical protein
MRIKTVLPIFNLRTQFTKMVESVFGSSWYSPLTLYCVAGTADASERKQISDTWVNLISPTINRINLYVEQDQPFSWGSMIPHLPPQLQHFGILPMVPIGRESEPPPAISYHDIKLICSNLMNRRAYLQTLDLRFLHQNEVPYTLGMLKSLPKLKVLRLTSPRWMRDPDDSGEDLPSQSLEATVSHSLEPWMALEELFIRGYPLEPVAGILRICSSPNLRSFVYTNKYEEASQTCSLGRVVGLLAEKWPSTLVHLSFEGETYRGSDSVADMEQIVNNLCRITSLHYLCLKSDHVMENCHQGHHTALRGSLPNLSFYDVPTIE